MFFVSPKKFLHPKIHFRGTFYPDKKAFCTPKKVAPNSKSRTLESSTIQSEKIKDRQEVPSIKPCKNLKKETKC